METTSLSSSTFSPSISSSCDKTRFLCLKRCKNVRVFARGRDSYEWEYGGGRVVDESMIILRKRIHEMKVVERNYEPPVEWAKWEKQYFACYDEIICNFVGIIQLQLMNTRPCLALGMIGLVAMSVPASTVMIFSHVMEVANGVFSTVHLG